MSSGRLELHQCPRGAFAGFVLAFHGAADSFAPDRAHAHLEACLGTNRLNAPGSGWRVFEGEGHYFHRTGTWAEIYTSIVRKLTR
jgi:hypothetical protein